MHETIEALSAYVDDEVSPAERARIEAHLATCVDCASRKVLLERASESLRALPAAAPTAEESRQIREGVLQQTRRAQRAHVRARRGRPRSWTGLRPVWAGAGALALVIVGIFAGWATLRDHTRPETTTARAGSSAAEAGVPVFDNPAEVRSFVSTDSEVKQALGALETLGALPPAGIAPAPAAGAQSEAARGAAPQAPDTMRYGSKALAQTPPDAGANSAGPPTTLEAPADSRRNDLQAAPGRSSSECLAEHQRDRADIRPAVARPATYSGQPAWLLVYAAPPPSPGAPEQVAVYLVGRADCNVLTYQVFGAP